MKSIKEEWLFFKSKIIANDASELQLSEMKMSFYAGAKVGMQNTVNSVEHYNTEDGTNYLMDIQEEVDLFFRAFK